MTLGLQGPLVRQLQRARRAVRGETLATLALSARRILPEDRSGSFRGGPSALIALKHHTPDRIGLAYEAEGPDYYGGAFVGASAIGAYAMLPEAMAGAGAIMENLTDDPYAAYVKGFVAHGRTHAGDRWEFADMVSAVYAASSLLQPESYLEIGVRRGRSMAIVGANCPKVSIVGIDMWVPDYAGIDNPGPDLVRDEMRRVGHTGTLELLSGDSHRVLPQLLLDRPELTFDLINVDGDHSPEGAGRDLLDVLPRLRIGGAVIFDDVAHPFYPALRSVWERIVVSDLRYNAWEFGDLGFGVAIAVRRW